METQQRDSKARRDPKARERYRETPRDKEKEKEGERVVVEEAERGPEIFRDIQTQGSASRQQMGHKDRERRQQPETPRDKEIRKEVQLRER